MKQLFFTALLLISAAGVNAQLSKKNDDLKKSLDVENKDTVAWVHSGIFTLGGNEGFLHNWAAGGEIASIVVNSVFHANLTYLHHTSIWSNSLDLNYGLNYAYSNDFVPRKTDDQINFTSNYARKFKNSKDFYFAGLFNFRSQFTKGYNYAIPGWETMPTSTLLSPAYTTLAIGAEYRKGDDFSLFLSPAAAREVFASTFYTSQSAQGAFGIDSGKTSVFQFGAYFSGRYKVQITKSIVFSTRLDLYSNYLAKDTKNAAGEVVKQDNPGNIQCYWDNLLVIKAYRNVNVTFGLTLAYDNDIPFSNTYLDKTTNTVVSLNQPGNGLGWLELDQVFSIGLAYKF